MHEYEMKHRSIVGPRRSFRQCDDISSPREYVLDVTANKATFNNRNHWHDWETRFRVSVIWMSASLLLVEASVLIHSFIRSRDDWFNFEYRTEITFPSLCYQHLLRDNSLKIFSTVGFFDTSVHSREQWRDSKRVLKLLSRFFYFFSIY